MKKILITAPLRQDADVFREYQKGLDGLEVAHPDHDADMRRTIARWAEEFDLVPTAGSDFHGERVIPERRLCECGMARAELEALRRRRSGAR